MRSTALKSKITLECEGCLRFHSSRLAGGFLARVIYGYNEKQASLLNPKRRQAFALQGNFYLLFFLAMTNAIRATTKKINKAQAIPPNVSMIVR